MVRTSISARRLLKAIEPYTFTTMLQSLLSTSQLSLCFSNYALDLFPACIISTILKTTPRSKMLLCYNYINLANQWLFFSYNLYERRYSKLATFHDSVLYLPINRPSCLDVLLPFKRKPWLIIFYIHLCPVTLSAMDVLGI